MGNCVSSKSGKKDPTTLSEDEINLLLNNTRLTRAQILALHKNFLNECPSGKLTKKDFIKLFKEVHPSENKKEKADKFCEYVFKVIDGSNQGFITFHDFVLCFSLTSFGDFKQKCEFAFKLYDLDRDGKISKKEMTQVLEALYDLSGLTGLKGSTPPAKIVENIINKLNSEASAAVAAQAPTTSSARAPTTSSAPAAPTAPAPAPPVATTPLPSVPTTPASPAPATKAPIKDAKKETKEKTKEKPVKETKPKEKSVKELKPTKPVKGKPIDFITKDQFIDACCKDESIKKILIDSIFAASDAKSAPAINVKSAAPTALDASIKLDAPAVVTGIALPEVKVEAPVVQAAAPVVIIEAAAPVIEEPVVFVSKIESKTTTTTVSEDGNKESVITTTVVDLHEDGKTVSKTSEVKIVNDEVASSTTKTEEKTDVATVSLPAVSLENVIADINSELNKVGAQINVSAPEVSVTAAAPEALVEVKTDKIEEKTVEAKVEVALPEASLKN